MEILHHYLRPFSLHPRIIWSEFLDKSKLSSQDILILSKFLVVVRILEFSKIEILSSSEITS